MSTRRSIKVVLLGDQSAGKTCLMWRYFKNEFNSAIVTTISGSFEKKIYNVDGREYQMGVWDTSGEEKYQAVSRLYYRKSDAAVLCYDVTMISSFRRLHYWLTELRNVEPDCRIYLCATKCDLLQRYEANPRLSYVESYARENGAKFFQTSSVNGENIEELFNEILEDYMCESRDTPDITTDTINLPSNRFQWRKRKKKCCANR